MSDKEEEDYFDDHYNTRRIPDFDTEIEQSMGEQSTKIFIDFYHKNLNHMMTQHTLSMDEGYKPKQKDFREGFMRGFTTPKNKEDEDSDSDKLSEGTRNLLMTF